MHPNANGVLHYHAASPCLANSNLYSSTAGVTASYSDVKTYLQQQWANSPYRSTFGIAKDGRPIYTPLHNNGLPYVSCDVDVCNGINLNGTYAYVTTLFHPYIMGCYG